MEWINYHHLLYFWVVAREGGLVAAGKVLRLSHPTLSAQVHSLEDQLGEKLFTKVGRRLTLTDAGKVVYRYADEIFSLGREMVDTVKGRTGQPLRLSVGIADVVPKLVVRRLLQPAYGLPEPVRLVCHEATFENLLAGLATQTFDFVISDGPVPTGSPVRGYSSLLAESGVSFYGTRALVKAHRAGFPGSLNGAPVLLPLENLTLRRSLNHWFEQHRIKPRIVGEFEDSALLKAFGAEGAGLFPAPEMVEPEVLATYRVERLGQASGVTERFYAISTERRFKHPAFAAISGAVRHDGRAK